MVGSGSGTGKFDRIRIREKGPDPQHWTGRVSEPACFGAAPAPGKENIILDFFKLATNCLKYVLTHVRVPYMFTLEKTSNEFKFHVICVNY